VAQIQVGILGPSVELQEVQIPAVAGTQEGQIQQALHTQPYSEEALPEVLLVLAEEEMDQAVVLSVDKLAVVVVRIVAFPRSLVEGILELQVLPLVEVVGQQVGQRVQVVTVVPRLGRCVSLPLLQVSFLLHRRGVLLCHPSCMHIGL
jgi:hypothetical protein